MRGSGCRSILLVADGSCEAAKNIDVLPPCISVIKNHIEDMKTSLKVQTGTWNDIPVQDASGPVDCRERVHLSDEQNRFRWPWLRQMYAYR